MAAPTTWGTFYYVGVGVGHAKSPAVVGVRFAEARMCQALAVEWLAGRLPLKGPDGKPVEPITTVPEPSSEELASIPGAKQAWEGLAKLQLAACQLSGNEVVIKPTWATEFAQAPRDIAEAFALCQAEHEKTWQRFLSGYNGPLQQVGQAGEAKDDREVARLK